MAQKEFSKFKMKPYLWSIIFTTVLFLSTPLSADAKSSYVLPYPSSMPGGLLYKINLVKEEVLKYWYFGDFGQFQYNLKFSDKYLVEAKTLFDYKQYLLASNALLKSDIYFKKIKPVLNKAAIHKKIIKDKEKILGEVAEKHIEELVRLKENTPSIFVWMPEKDSSTTLEILKMINDSIEIRKKYL